MDVDSSNLSPHIMLLLLVSASTLSKIYCKNMMSGKLNPLHPPPQKKCSFNKAKIYIIRNCCPKYQESTKFSTENEKTEEHKRKSMHGQF